MAGFASVTIALFVIQPGEEPRDRLADYDTSDVTRAQTDLTRVGLANTDGSASDVDESALGFGLMDVVPADVPAPVTEESAAVQSIVADLRPAPRATVTQPAVTAGSDAASPAGDSPLELLVIRALQQGQSEDYIDALVNDAAVTGRC